MPNIVFLSFLFFFVFGFLGEGVVHFTVLYPNLSHHLNWQLGEKLLLFTNHEFNRSFPALIPLSFTLCFLHFCLPDVLCVCCQYFYLVYMSLVFLLNRGFNYYFLGFFPSCFGYSLVIIYPYLFDYLCFALANLDHVYLIWFVRSWLALIYSLMGGFNFLELARDGFVILKAYFRKQRP
jgi:hypothetical protein